MSYYTVGAAPNRQLVVQWTNWGFFSSALNEASFQIRLYETTNLVQVVYGNCPGTTAANPQVGLSGTTNADFNDRTTTTDWSATTAGPANTSNCTFFAPTVPASGQTYTWTPALPPND
ncbi:MAG TPA: hypothetical protein VFJ43_10580, partial [Bacteroidia bacterium]|nr:hypothetical protein [Bacteroidia bacterium]